MCTSPGKTIPAISVVTVCKILKLHACVSASDAQFAQRLQMNPPKPAAPYLQTEVIMHNLMMVESYKRKVGK